MKKRGNRPALRRRSGRGSAMTPARHSLPLPFDSPAPLSIPNQKALSKRIGLFNLVEMGGIEPPSESTLTGTSPGADDYLHSLIRAGSVTLTESVAS